MGPNGAETLGFRPVLLDSWELGIAVPELMGEHGVE